MHSTEAVAEPRRSDLGKDELSHPRLRDVAQSLRNRVIQNLALEAGEQHVAMNWVAHAARPSEISHRPDLMAQ